MRILIVKTSSMGDVVHALPLAADIAAALPAAQIDWLCEEAFAAIPAMSRYIGAVHRVALRRWRKRPFDPTVWREVRIAKNALRDARYDVVLDVQGLAKSAWLARWTNAPVTGFDSSTAREPIAARLYQYHLEVPRSLHAIERCRRLGAAALGYTVSSAPRFGIGSGVPQSNNDSEAAVLLVNASRATKLWSHECWISVERWLSDRGIKSVLFAGSVGEQLRAQSLAAHMQRAEVRPPSPLGAIASTLATASIVIGLDTGLTHLAAALGRPTVGIFCDYDPALVGLTGDADAGNTVVSVGSATTGFGGARSHRSCSTCAESLAMTLARAAYTAVAFLAIPFAALHLLWRSRRQPEYRLHWAERFGLARYVDNVERPLIWIHAVSLGETRAAEPLIDALAAQYPRHDFLLTHMTPTGREAGAQIAARIPGRVLQTYLPYDLPYAVRRFLSAFKPVIGITVETEAWPNLVAIASEHCIPMALVNGRLSERSYRRSRRYAALMRETAARFSVALAQTHSDATRFRKVGASGVDVTGNLKFDFAPDEVQIARGKEWRGLLGKRPVWLFASTRDGEEALILDALAETADATILIVPRHPQRFDEVAELIEARGLRLSRRSQSNFRPDQHCHILLGDSMGEMTVYYATADVAFIGGSLLALGGQNLIEACAVGTPVVVGPHTFNFEQAASDAIEAGAAIRVESAKAAIAAMASIANDRLQRERMSEAALQFAGAHRGATARTLARLAPLIEAASAVELVHPA